MTVNGVPARFEKTTAQVGTPDDYRQLAALSDEYRVSFVTLAEVLEEQGKTPEEVRVALDKGDISMDHDQECRANLFRSPRGREDYRCQTEAKAKGG